MAKSFYNLDYLIEVSEKRLEEYTTSYQKIFDGITNIILVYSILGIFLTAFVRHVMRQISQVGCSIYALGYFQCRS